ncbi:MAG: exo-alpha-sialidase, partial [Anaerolineae bacterium]|nr:exo-alpha-sialidase [Anaerolineae bacterium]
MANLSQSASASDPVLLAGARGSGVMQAFWWDQFDGLTTALYYNDAWSRSQPAPILLPTVVKEEVVLEPIETMPGIFRDAAARAHAFWLGPANKETGVQPLLHSVLNLGTATWSEPITHTEAASVWRMTTTPNGAMHLIYFRPVETSAFPAGAYHQRSGDGVNWSAPSVLQRSLYFRRTDASSHVEIKSDSNGVLHVTWDDPRSGEAVYTRSTNGGAGWSPVGPFHSQEPSARRARIVAGQDGEVLALWEAASAVSRVGLYQQRSSDGGETWGAPEAVLEGLAGSADLALEAWEERYLLVSGARRGQLTLALYDREQAQEPGQGRWSDLLAVPFAAGETGSQRTLQVAAWRSLLAGDVLTLIGQGRDRDIWGTRIALGDLEWTYGPPPPWTPLVGQEGADASTWSAPANLSRSGAASQPALVAGQGGRCQAFWWDRFDGLTSAFYDGRSWFAPLPSPISALRLIEDQTVSQPIEVMPSLFGDGLGGAHAFWLSKPENKDEPSAFLHSRLAIGSTEWSRPEMLAPNALAWQLVSDGQGGLHLVYLCNVHTSEHPSGIYHLRSDDGGETWSAPTSLNTSLYFRLLDETNAHLSAALDDDGRLHVTWDDPQTGQALYARSEEGGNTWGPLWALGADGVGAQKALLVAERGDTLLSIWQAKASDADYRLYEQGSLDGGLSWGAPERVLTAIRGEPDGPSSMWMVDGIPLLVAGRGGRRLRFAAWDASGAADAPSGGWSDLKEAEFAFTDEATSRQVVLDDLQAAVCGDWIMVIGQGEDEIWAAQRPLDALAWVFAPPDVWSAPVQIQADRATPVGPAVALDGVGGAHVLWSELGPDGVPISGLLYASWDGRRWTNATQLFPGGGGQALRPALAVMGDQLFMVAGLGSEGELVAAKAFANDAYIPSAWSEPVPLQGSEGGGADPVLRADLNGRLHVVYAVPLNEGRGIYYTRSEDEGASWTPASAVFDAQAAGWAQVGRPTLAVDVGGTLHVAWLRWLTPGHPLPQAIYYAKSEDGGASWSAPALMAEGAYDRPSLAVSAPDRVHLLWTNAPARDTLWHRWSSHGGARWETVAGVAGLRNLTGGYAAADDSLTALHVLALGRDAVGEPALLHARWLDSEDRWEQEATSRLGWGLEPGEAAAAALAPEMGQLAIVLGVSMLDEADDSAQALIYRQRAVGARTVDVNPYRTPQPTPTATPSPTPTATPTARPTVNAAAPP